MRYSEQMIQELPQYERDNKLINEIYRVFGNKAEDFLYKIDDLYKQLNIDTATWGLDVWERNFSIKSNHSKSYKERRADIKIKLKRHGKVDHVMLESIIKDFTGCDSQVLFDSRIIITFTNNEKIHFSRDMKTAIDEVKPAHLGYDYIVKQLIDLIFNLKTYTFGVPYKICNMFQTADISGGFMKVVLGLNVESYAFDVLYPICNTFTTSQITIESVKNNVILASEYRDNEVLFKRVGSANVGEGDI